MTNIFQNENKTLTMVFPIDEVIEGNTIAQLERAATLPVFMRGALLPDAHLGYALPIGGVAALRNAVSPAFVGYDISCHVELSVFDEPEAILLGNQENLHEILRNVTSFGVGSDFPAGEREHEVMEEDTWQMLKILKELHPLAVRQLGSSGGGNHFADLVILNIDGYNQIGLMTHSGSRGTGHKLATHYSKLAQAQTAEKYKGIHRDYSWLDLDSDEGAEYWLAMNLMNRYTLANHELIHRHFVEESGLTPTHVFRSTHNLAWVEDVTMPDGSVEKGVVHRKGATPIPHGSFGVIPGTCGTQSFLVEGLGYPDTMNSSSHGAGRMRSRKASKKLHNQREFEDYMQAQGIVFSGIDGDETPKAYKDIAGVISAQEDTILEVVAPITPKVVVMGGKSDDGD